MKRTYRRLAAAFALAGIAFYALLLPWHLTSQFDAQLFKAQFAAEFGTEFGALAQTMCTGSGSGAPTEPGAPASSCPICKGLAAFHIAIAPADQPAVAAPEAIALAFDHAREDLTGARTQTPRNRGPPLNA
jgi:hypothetical protein